MRDRRRLGRAGAAGASARRARRALPEEARRPHRRADAARTEAAAADFVVDNSGDEAACRADRRRASNRELVRLAGEPGPLMRPSAAPRATLAAVVVAGALALAGPAPHAGAAEPPPPRLRAAQILPSAAATRADVEASLRRLRDAGVDTVIVRAFQNRGDRPLLLRARPATPPACTSRPAAAPVVADHLGLVSAACRRLGLSVSLDDHARQRLVVGERPDLADLRYDGAVGQVLPSGRVNVFHPAARRRLRALFADLARTDIDGILFQDDLVLKAGEGSPRGDRGLPRRRGPAVSPALLFEPPAAPGRHGLLAARVP